MQTGAVRAARSTAWDASSFDCDPGVIMTGLTGMLPGGHWDSGGVLHREFELATLTGRDEELLAQADCRETASMVTAVLSHGVRRVGDIAPVTEDVARQLLVADRQYLLLKLRQLTFGAQVRADLFCPWTDCGRRVSLQFALDHVPVEEPPLRAPLHVLSLSPRACEEDPEQCEVSFRLPNGADQEDVSPLLAHNEAEALSCLLARTVQRIGDHAPPGRERVAALSPLARAEIEAEMERLAPKIELDIDTGCPECGRSFVVPFDLQRLFFGDLRGDRDLLYRQVHYLAYHYHWSENEIMTMPRAKRHAYIDLLADEIERLNNGE
jgi:uncharacterized protein DUF6760